MEFFSTAVQFLKLEKVEIGGIRGKALTSNISKVSEEFKDLYSVFSLKTYDSLDPKDEGFIKDNDKFKKKIASLDRKLGAILNRAFEDCIVSESIFKLLHIFGTLTDRPLIAKELDDKMPKLIEILNTELDATSKTFEKQEARLSKNCKPIIDRNMPVIAGELSLSYELKHTMSANIKSFKEINHPVIKSKDAAEILKKFETIKKVIDDYEENTYLNWAFAAEKKTEEGLNRPLILRQGTVSILKVNFGKETLEILSEVKNLRRDFPERPVPQKAGEIFRRFEEYRKYNNSLEQMVQLYNFIKRNAVTEELLLIERDLAEIDKDLEPAEKTLTWKSENLWNYVDGLRKKVQELSMRVKQSKLNITKIDELIYQWHETSIIERSSGPKSDGMLNIEEKEIKKAKRYEEIKVCAGQIHDLVLQNDKLFLIDKVVKRGSKRWRRYLQRVDEIVLNGLLEMIASSLGYLLHETDYLNDINPLFTVSMELFDPNIIFRPSLDKTIHKNFFDNFCEVIDDIFNMATLVPRISMPEDDPATFLEIALEHEELSEMKQNLIDRIEEAMKLANDEKELYQSYSHLWMENMNEVLFYFLNFARQLTEEEQLIFEEDEKAIKKCSPTLNQFKEQIDYYEGVYESVLKIEDTKVFNKWFKIDILPLKLQLQTLAKKWSWAFKEHLLKHIITSLQELEDFIEQANFGLSIQLSEGDYDNLIKVMEYLQLVRDKQSEYDEMFQPLKEIIAVINVYDVDIPENTILQLQELPEKWAAIKRLSVTAKQTVIPLQGQEIGKLKAKIDTFQELQQDFRKKYQQLRVFSYNSKNPYELLSNMHLEIEVLELEVAELKSQASLFEVEVPDLEMINQCRLENGMLKILWDYIFFVRTSIEEWKTTAWKDIDVENMDMECKKFVKDIRGLDKTMRAWHAYLGLDTTVKNMITSIRAVGELQNPAIKERHWDQLVQATKVKFTMSDEATLADLLSLNLHNFEDEVQNIVDKACKEMAMEKILKDLNTSWKTLEFDYELHSSGYKLLRPSEELVTTLEENQVQVQNMMSSKYIAFFLTEMSSWQKTLCLIDNVLSRWLEVQRVWSHLQSIFLGSEDIRIQLPDDTKRFDDIDKEFKEMMKKMAATPNVVKGTNDETIPSRLDDLSNRMTLCEKALSEYLETKRLAFPRFYFVSTTDLLDILSNGQNPTKVSKHLTKLFDSMAKLKMREDSNGKEIKVAHSMVAKDGETVPFLEDCNLDGQVENWLHRLMLAMRVTIRNEFDKSMKTYRENARDKWLMLYPAQVSLAGTQIWWTTEVSTAFSRLEEGYENALKDYYKKQISQLNALIVLLLGNLSKGERQKVMTICTIDVHSRDTVSKLISQKVESNFAFSWQSQLRHRWDKGKEDCFANICDAEFRYCHEYLGNTPRLVITPLTDRCYITLTQSLHLIMGGAPQGPAGTGKTETTKDLGRAIGIMVYVFNCSEQMDYKSCGNIFKGLAQTGAWGCFDEFNRITVEVLSVIAVQVKCIQDAIRDKKEKFDFMNSLIPMIATIGYFITMNPGYAGRAELPENLKVLFRPCAMCVPDLRLICEIMLVAEGFLEARSLSNKFITLYNLCKELLSKQDHYDWGLRAIKSVLVVAGSLKRSERDRPEDQVLMRALRDFNTPKIITEDMPVFLGLIADLFPNLDVPRKRDPVFEKSVKMAACDLKLQPEENFIMKVCQFDELLSVRHSVFIVGDAGTGKTQTWKTLVKTYANLGKNPTYTDLNPKAVTNDELFGYVNAASREWKDGLFSNIMRDLANLSCEGPKWIVLDGDIDPMWIESLNTVMDDNKILTLASNERIAVTPDMRLIFEISNLRTATPATVSRAGILYINPGDLGWNPYVTSWVETREDQKEKAILTLLFDKYIPICIEIVNKKFRTITPIPGICYIQILCNLLEALILPKNIGKDPSDTTYESWFVFSLVWSFGSALYHDGSTDYKSEFSKWFTAEFKNLEIPPFTSVFDVFVDPNTQQFLPWAEKVPKFELEPDVPLQACLVHNSETIRVKFFMDILMETKFPVMLIGLAGSGKH